MGFFSKKGKTTIVVSRYFKQKFKVNQEVYILANDSIKIVKIKSATITVDEHGHGISYSLYNSPYGDGMKIFGFNESDLFETKKDLVDSILK